MYSIIVKVRIVVVLQKLRSYLVLTSSMVVMYAEQLLLSAPGENRATELKICQFTFSLLGLPSIDGSLGGREHHSNVPIEQSTCLKNERATSPRLGI